MHEHDTPAGRKSYKRLVLALVCLAAARELLADPMPTPAPTCPRLPMGFCFRITDIREVKSPPFAVPDTYDVEFEILNWSDKPATGLDLSIADPNPGGVFFGTISTPDANGRPIADPGVNEDCNNNGILDIVGAKCGAGCANPGPPCDEDTNNNGRLDTPNRPPCNANLVNNWVVSVQTSTRAVWAAGTPIPNINMLNCAGKSAADMDALIPCTQAGACMPCVSNAKCVGAGNPVACCTGAGTGTCTGDINNTTGEITPHEAIDDGPEVMDGFVLRLSQLRGGGFPAGRNTVNINWFLTNNGITIGKSGFGNQFGFGVLTLTRTNLGGPQQPVFFGQAGAAQSTMEFFDSVFTVPDPASFAFEAGTSITASFSNPTDNVYNAAINAQVIPPAGPAPRPLFTPGVLFGVMVTLLAAGIWVLQGRWH